MLKYYFKISWRNLGRSKGYTLINAMGLALGMAAAFFIFLWVNNEYSFDRYHEDAERIYRLTTHSHRTPERANADAPYLLGEEIQKQLPEIQAFTRLRPITGFVPSMGNDGQLFKENAAAYVDEHWFDVFYYDFLDGSPLGFNSQPHSLILTVSAAVKYFGETTDVIGAALLVDGVAYTVQGVISDAPTNSSFRYNVYMPVAARHSNPFWKERDLRYDYNSYRIFIKVSPGVSTERLATRMKAIASKEWNQNYDLSLLPLKDLHFESNLDFTDARHGNRQMTNVLLLLGILLLVVACINYVNLTTARATIRAREVGIKKIGGAGRIHLFIQFVMETVLLGLIALLAALLLTWAFLPFFNGLTGLQFELSLSDLSLWMLYGGTLSAVLIMAGFYPSLVLSAFRPIAAIRGNSIGAINDSTLRKVLVVVQFSISVALMASTLVIHRQMQFINLQYDHYDKSQVFSFLFPTDRNISTEEKNVRFENVRQELSDHSSIADAAVSSGNNVVDMRNEDGPFDWDGRDEHMHHSVTFFPIGSTLNELYRLKLKEGRWFLPDSREDERNFILNETAVQELGIREPVVGQRFSLLHDTGRIIGVVEDFHYRSVRERIGPVVFGNNPWYANSFTAKSVPGRQVEAIAAAEQVFRRHLPGEPFEYRFISEEFEQVYREDHQAATLITGFSLLAILVSCFGLYGLTAFSAERRFKEIGIRKVLGASVAGIVTLLSNDFLKLILIGFVIAIPIAWYAMNRWLEDFAYRIEIGPGVFLLAGRVAVLIALATVSWQSVKAALTNPVDSLRSE